MSKYRRTYYLKNREKILEQNRISYNENKELFLKRNKEWRIKNMEKVREYARQQWAKQKAIDEERRTIFNSLSNEEQINEMLNFVKDERERQEKYI